MRTFQSSDHPSFSRPCRNPATRLHVQVAVGGTHQHTDAPHPLALSARAPRAARPPAAKKAGLVGGEGFAVDASLIVADANKKQRSIPGAEGNKERTAKDAAELATL